MISLELLKNRGVSILPKEDSFRTHLENIQRELDKPNQYKSRIQALHDRLQSLKEMKLARNYENLHYEVVDPNSLQHIYKFLLEQKKGLAHLTEILQNSMRELQIIKRGYMELGREPQALLGEILDQRI
jgi:nuclear pore complex protein Nup54